MFLFFLSLYSYCYPNELLPFFLFLFFPTCPLLLSFLLLFFLLLFFLPETVTFFPVTFFPVTFFPCTVEATVACNNLPGHTFSPPKEARSDLTRRQEKWSMVTMLPFFLSIFSIKTPLVQFRSEYPVTKFSQRKPWITVWLVWSHFKGLYMHNTWHLTMAARWKLYKKKQICWNLNQNIRVFLQHNAQRKCQQQQCCSGL